METAVAVGTNEEFLWQSCLTALEPRFTKGTFEAWIKPMRLQHLTADEVTLAVRNSFAKDWAENRLKSQIMTVLAEMGFPLTVRFIVLDDPLADESALAGSMQPPEEAVEAPPAAAHADDFRHTGLNDRYTFEQFVVGANNRFAHAAAQAVADAPARAYNPLFIYGPVGLGKTHLMHAIGHRVLKGTPRSRVVYVSSETFTNEFITAIRNNETVEFRNRYRTVDVLLIDDIQFLEGKEQTQEEFFHTFNTLREATKQLVISSDRPPKDIQTLENRLRSRFEWGLLADIQPADLETREAILRKKAESDGIDVPHEVTSYIAKIIPSNIRQLEGALIKLTAYASLYQKPITVELATEVLRNEINEVPLRKVTIAMIKEKVARFNGITLKELEGQRRDHRLTVPRQIAMYLCCDLTNASLPQIAREFGKKDHTTVMYARNKVKEQMERDPDFRSKVKSMLATITQDG